MIGMGDWRSGIGEKPWAIQCPAMTAPRPFSESRMPNPESRLLAHSHRAGQPVDVHTRAAPGFAQGDVAAAGTSVREIADACDAPLSTGFGRRLDVDGCIRRQAAWLAPRHGVRMRTHVDAEPLRLAGRH